MFNYFKKFLFCLLYIGILPSAYAMNYEGISNLYNKLNQFNYTLQSSFTHIMETGDFTPENLQIIQQYLDKGHSPNIIIGDSKETPLTLAIKHKSLETVKLLLQYKVNINAPNRVVKNKNLEPLLSLHHKININASNNYHEETPLSIAIKTNNFEITECLLEHGADPNRENVYSLVEAAKNQNLEMVKLLLQYKADINASDRYNNTPLSIAIKANNFEMAKYLLEHGADPNMCEDLYPLVEAIKNQNLEMVKLLLQYNANINTSNRYEPLSIAIETDNFEIAECLLERYPNYECRNLLRAAVEHNNFEMAKYLLEHGADPNYYEGKNLLIKTIKNQDLEMVRLLLQYKANIIAFDYHGDTPLSIAIKIGNLEIIKMLCNAGALLTLDNNITVFNLLLGRPEIYYTTVIMHARFAQELLDKTTKCIELLVTLKKLYIPEEICLANLKELYIKLYLADLQKDYNKLYSHASLQELYNKQYTSAGLKELYYALNYLKKLNSRDKDSALKILYAQLPAVKHLNIFAFKLMSADQTFDNFMEQAFDNFLQKKFDDFVQQKFISFVKELYKELDVITYRNPILTQVYKCLMQLKKILQIQNNQNQTALQLLQIVYSHDPAYIQEIAPLLDGTKLDDDFNELKNVLAEISNSEKIKKLDPVELISLLNAKLDQNNLALGIYKNCALLEETKN